MVLRRSRLRAHAYDIALFLLVLAIGLSLLFGGLRSLHGNMNSFKTIHLKSEEDTGASTNLGTITLGGVSYGLPDNVSKKVGTYSAEYLVDVCYLFDHWETTCQVSVSNANDNPTNVTVSGHGILKAIYAHAPTYTLNITSMSGGTTNPVPSNYTYCEGVVVSVAAISDSGFDFTRWELDGVDVGSANPYAVVMDADHTLHAIFTQVTFTLTITGTTGGSTNPPFGAQTYYFGTDVPVTANPDAGSYFDHWELDSVSVGSANPYAVVMDADHTLHAVFEPVVSYTLNITSTGGGTTSPSPGAYSYEEGTVVEVTANPNRGYAFDHWVLDGLDTISTNLILVTMNEDHTLHAIFTRIPQSPTPVGGHATPIGKTHFLTPKIDLIPGICLTCVLLTAMAITIVLIKSRNKKLNRKNEDS